MRATTLFFVVLLGMAGAAEARQSWDVGGTIGAFGNAPQEPPSSYDHWYFTPRYAASIGKYWTDHLKTEVELAGSGEGSRYAQHFVNVPGVPADFPFGAQEYYRLHQLSGRLVYQFFENAWMHPYVFGGAALDVERRRTEIHEQYYYASHGPNVPVERILAIPSQSIGPTTTMRPAAVFGTGAKVYMTPRAYFNATAITSFSSASRTLSFVAGFGVDFP
jgi:hypothetical protein